MKDLLAERIKQGDEQAFELLFRKYFFRLYGYARKFLDDTDQAKEIVQEVFARIWEGREDIDPEASMKAYIFKITHNLSLNKLKRLKVETKYTEIYKLVYLENYELSPHDSLLVKELEENIRQAIKTLPVECQKIFRLSRQEGLKYREIAGKLNISEKTVEAQITKALRMIRIELKDYLLLLLLALIFIHQ